MKLMLRYFFIGLSLVVGFPINAQVVLGANVAVDALYDDQFDNQILDSETGGIRYLPNITFGYEGQTYQTGLSLRAGYNVFLGSDFEDTENFSASWTNTRNFERSTVRVNFDFDQRLIDDYFELDNVIELFRTDVVTSQSVAPDLSWRLSERTRLSVFYQFRNTGVDNTSGFNLSDFSEHFVNVGWNRSLSERAEFSIFARFITHRPEGENGTDTNTMGLSVGGNYQLKNNWTLSGSIGATQVANDGPSQVGVANGDTVLFTDLQASYSGRRTQFDIIANAGTNQQLDGTVDSQQTIGINWGRRLSENFSANIGARFFRAGRFGRQDLSITPALTWRSSPQWSYRLSYRFRDQLAAGDNFTEAAGIAAEDFEVSSNRVVFRVNYTFKDLILGN